MKDFDKTRAVLSTVVLGGSLDPNIKDACLTTALAVIGNTCTSLFEYADYLLFLAPSRGAMKRIV